MRDFKGMKRQRGRNRGGGGGGQQGGGKPQHNINRAFDSNGPDNIKVRGNAQHVYEKYQALARDATLGGDRVLAENHLQHAEHYFRTLRAIQPNRAASEIVSRDGLTSGYDIDFEDEAVETAMEQADAQAAARAAEPQPEPSAEPEAQAQTGEGQQPRFDRDRQGGDRQWRDRSDRPQGEFRDRNDRPQGGFNAERQDRERQGGGDRPAVDRPQGEFRDRGDRPRFRDRDDRFRDREPRPEGERPRDERSTADRAPREDRPVRDDRGERPRFRERDERFREPRAEGEAAAEPAREPRSEPAPLLRSEDGGASDAPAFLQAPVPALDAEAGEARRPRVRRRRPRDEGEAEAPASAPEVEEA